MKVFFNPRMSVDSGGYSPSGSKPAAVVTDWQTHGLAIEICDFQPVTEEDLCLAHDRRYVESMLSGRLANGHGNTLPEVTNACLWTCGSMLSASRQALVDGIAVSPSSGFHHAHYSSNGGFCTFNGLIVTAEKLRSEGLLQKIGIVDCDAHYGDGSDDIIEQLELQDHVKHWTFGGVFDHGTFSRESLQEELRASLHSMKSDGVELILFQAGADVHVLDPLGGWMESDEMRERDQLVLQTCHDLKLPITINLAGGYQRDADGKIDAVLALHRATIEEALKVFGQSSITPKKRSRLRDTTRENLGKSISIIGGVRAPKKTERSDSSSANGDG